MGNFFSSPMSVFKRLIILLVFVIANMSCSDALECVVANDVGSSFSVVVKANPEGLRNDSGYKQDSKMLLENADELPDDISPSQRADWVDSKVFTSVADGFYFEIEGAWTPWYGNIKVVKDKFGNEITVRANKNQFCILETLNHGSGKFGTDGEFDYITSAYSVSEVNGQSKYKKNFPTPDKQQPCWLTAGEGLYIAFFGKSGYELPEIATHLKTAVIACDNPYNTDKNGDGLLTVDECYLDKDNKKNMAYYKPYRSEYLVGGVRCDKDYFHGTNQNKIGINDCYEEIEKGDGTKERVDRTIFTFEAPYLYKQKNKSIVRNNERIKFIIYDRYYRDNVGQYTINMLRGISDTENEGIIKKILGDLEKTFVGSRNEKGVLTGGILMQFYNYIVRDAMFAWVCRVSVILYMCFLGLQFAMGSLEYKTKELMTILLKLTFVLAFTTATSWQIYDYFVVRFFLDGFSDIIVMIANITNRMFDPSASNIALGGSLSNKFQFIDDSITFLFSQSVTRKIQGLFFGVWFGFIVIPILYILIIYYIYQLVNAVFPHIIMFIQAVLGLVLGPIFISFYLFKTTEHLFKNWLAFIGARFANMAFLFLFLFSFSAMIKHQFSKLLMFEVCKVPLLQAASNTDGNVDTVLNFFSFGIKVWDAKWTEAYPQPGFIAFCVDLLFIGVLIYLYGVIAKKVPTIIDGMISIGGESGGGLKRGRSVLGSDLQTLSEAVDDSIKVGDNNEGLLSAARRSVGGGIKKLSGKARRGLWNSTVGRIKSAIKEKSDSSKFMLNAIEDSKLKGMDAINKAANDYKSSLKGSGKYTYSEISDKVDKFKSEMIGQFIRDPINKEMQRISKDINAMTSNGMKLSSDTIDRLVKDRMDDFVGRELATSPTQIGEYDNYYKGLDSLKRMKESANGKGRLSQSEFLRVQRAFKLQEAASRLGMTARSLADYNKNILDRLNKNDSLADRRKNRNEAKRYDDDISGLSRKNLLEGHKGFMKEQERLARAQYAQVLREKAALLERQKKLLSEFDNKRKQQEKDNLDKEIARMKKMSENARLDQETRERSRLQMEALQKRMADNEAEVTLKAKLAKAVEDGNEAERQRIKNELERLKSTMTGYEELAKASDELSYGRRGFRVDSAREDYALQRELGRSDLSKARRDQLEQFQANKAELQRFEAQAMLSGNSKAMYELGIRRKALEDQRKRLLQNADKDSLFNKGSISKIDEDAGRLEELKRRAENDEQSRKIDEQLRDLRNLEAKKAELGALDGSDLTRKAGLEKEIDALSGAISDRKSEIEDSMDLLNHLRDNDDKALELYKEISDINAEDAALQKNLGDLLDDAKDIVSINDVGNDQYDTHGSVNLAVEGIGDDFGLKGVTGVGLGEDNDDLVGFGKGAAAAVLGADFEGTSGDDAKTVDDTTDMMNRTRLRIAKQQHKILEFQLAQAEFGKDEKTASELKDQIKEIKKQIRIIQDDVDENS